MIAYYDRFLPSARLFSGCQATFKELGTKVLHKSYQDKVQKEIYSAAKIYGDDEELVEELMDDMLDAEGIEDDFDDCVADEGEQRPSDPLSDTLSALFWRRRGLIVALTLRKPSSVSWLCFLPRQEMTQSLTRRVRVMTTWRTIRRQTSMHFAMQLRRDKSGVRKTTDKQRQGRQL